MPESRHGSRRDGAHGQRRALAQLPRPRELLEALHTDEVDALSQAAETVDGETPGATFTTWLRRFFAFFTSKRTIASELLEHADGDDPLFGRNRARVLAAGRPLLVAAQHAHEVRADLTLEQIVDVIVSIAKIHGDEQYLEPILQTVLAGLRAPADGPRDGGH